MNRDQVEQIFDSSGAGQKIIDIGRTVSEVEARTADGTRLIFESLGFIDTMEYSLMLCELEGRDASEAKPVMDGPRYAVSGTLSGTVTTT